MKLRLEPGVPPILADAARNAVRLSRPPLRVIQAIFVVLGALVLMGGVSRLMRGVGDIYDLGWSLAMAAPSLAIAGAFELKAARASRRLVSTLNDPAEVLWIFQRVVRINHIVPVTCVVLALSDGTEDRLQTTEAEASRILAALRSYVPHASFGYSEVQRSEYLARLESIRLDRQIRDQHGV